MLVIGARSRKSTLLLVICGVMVGGAALPAHAVGGGGGTAAAKAPVKVHPELPIASGFGGAVAASGDTVIAGASEDEVAGRDSGSAFVFTAADGAWFQQALLLPDDVNAGDHFGWSVALDGDTALVGAPYQQLEGAEDVGAAYVFVRSGSTWTQQAKLTPSDAPGGLAGYSVALQGDTAVVGAPGSRVGGAVHVFSRSDGVWAQQSAIANPDPTTIAFGVSVSIDGETLVVGQVGRGDRGSAYVFVGSGARWVEQAQVWADDPTEAARFGGDVDVSDDTIVVGAMYDDTSSTRGGSAYIFRRDHGVWAQEAYLVPEETGAFDLFGNAVAVIDNVAVVGSYKSDPVVGSTGAAYLYRRDGGTWTVTRELEPPPPIEAEFFGQAVDITTGAGSATRTLVVGAPNDQSSGSIYLYR